IGASNAIVNAGPARARMIGSDRCGMLGWGTPAWIAPNRAPIVSTGKCKSCASSVVTINATNGPGIRVETLGQTTMMASVATATASAQGLTVSNARTYASHFGTN